MMLRFSIIIFCYSLLYAIAEEGITSYEPSITYMDGTNQWEKCNPYIGRTLTGKSGILISHHDYGTISYKGSKNCILMIAAPLGYQIRLKILDLSIPGIPGICDRDSLHILNHENPIDPGNFGRAAESQRTPGPIINNLCGPLWNNTQVMQSTHNALTIWWHTDARTTGKSEESGFRILWSAFRNPTENDPCSVIDEFQCANSECIPSSLACNRFADCEDSSDLDKTRQIANNCKNMATDLFSKLDGPRKLLFCLAIVTVGIVICAAICAIFYFLMPNCLKTKSEASKSTFTNANESLLNTQRPPVPNFLPPAQGIPNIVIGDYSRMPSNMVSKMYNPLQFQMTGSDQITNTTTTVKSSNPSAKAADSYYIVPPPPATPAASDYAYIQTDTNNIII